MDWEDEYEQDVWEDGDHLETKELFEPTHEEIYSFEGDEDFDSVVLDIDYSEFKGSFKNSLHKIKHKIKRRRKVKPLSKEFGVKENTGAVISGGRKQLKKIIIPAERDVTIEGVEEFILKDSPIKTIGYYEGKKLKELVISINNTSGVDFILELFNPSMPLDYLQSTTGNLNDRLVLSGSGNVSYTDFLHNILANPTFIPNARFVCSGPTVPEQEMQKLTFLNKAIDGEYNVNPLSLDLNKDLYQFQNGIVLFDIIGQLNRAFIPDGMDVVQYKVLAGMSVTFCFYYKQKSLKKFFFKEARKKKMVAGEFKGLL